MTISEQPHEQVAQSAIREISHIATLPEVTIRIVELVEDPRSTAEDLQKVISMDPALTSRILKVVNSSFYGLPGQIGSINRAIVMLGLNAVKNIAIAASLVKLFRGGELVPSVSAQKLWEHCAEVAAGCKLIDDALKLGLGDEVYLAGLVHDIGIVVEIQYDRSKLIEVLQQAGLDADGVPSGDLRELELRTFGATHEHFGCALCRAWKFPEVFADVTGFHHRPLELEGASRQVASVVHVADRLVARLPGGFRADLMSTEFDPQVIDELGLDQQTLDSLQEKLAEMEKSELSLAA